MLTKREADRIDRYFETHYSPTEVDIDYLNEVADFIVECIDPSYCQQNADKLLKTAEDVHRKMSAIADMGQNFLFAELGIDSTDVADNSIAYMRGWLKALKDDVRLVVMAASAAAKAVDYILGRKATE